MSLQILLASKAYLAPTRPDQNRVPIRSFQLRGAISLAKLYRATGRDAESHAALGSAFEGFASTPEFPEIEGALEIMTAIEAGPHL